MYKYKIFTRTFWKENKDWPNGLEPSLGRKTTIAYAKTEEEAKYICRQYNQSHPAGRLSRKAEYTSI